MVARGLSNITNKIKRPGGKLRPGRYRVKTN